MSQSTEVLTDQMKSVATKLEELISRYNSSVNKVYQIAGEIDAMWDGEASSKFMTVIGNDRPTFEAMARLLGEYIEVLRKDASIYETGERQVLDALQTSTHRK